MSIDLITLCEYKDYFRVPYDHTQDDMKLQITIKAISETIKAYCNRTFVDFIHRSKVEYFDATSFTQIVLKETPLLSVSYLGVSSDGGDTYTRVLDFFVKKDSVFSKTPRPFLRSTRFNKANSGKIVYCGGFASGLPETPYEGSESGLGYIEFDLIREVDSSNGFCNDIEKEWTSPNSVATLTLDVPEDLRMATAYLVHYFSEKEFIPEKSLQSAVLQNNPIKYNLIPGHIRMLLSKYKVEEPFNG